MQMHEEKNINWEILSLSRFLLALVVMTGHLSGLTNIGFLKFYTYLGSFEAILGFLIISGFSIGKSISKNKGEYLKRRMQRIYPVYIASITYQIAAGDFTFTPQLLTVVFLNLFFLNQLLINYSLVGPAWTLSVEVWLYCLAPLLLKLNTRWLNLIIFFSFVCYVTYTCGRTLFHLDYYSTTNYGINILLLAFIWVAGFKMAVHPKNWKKDKILIFLLFIAHILLTISIQVLYRIKHSQKSEIFSSDLLGFAGIIICLSYVYIVIIFNRFIPSAPNSIKKIFNLLGNISYPLYLTHLTTFLLLEKLGISNYLILFFSALLISYLVYLSFDFYSKKRLSKHGYSLLNIK